MKGGVPIDHAQSSEDWGAYDHDATFIVSLMDFTGPNQIKNKVTASSRLPGKTDISMTNAVGLLQKNFGSLDVSKDGEDAKKIS